MRAGFGANGLALEGSAEDLMIESERNAELDALLIRHGGMAQASTAQSGASLADYKGRLGYASCLLSAAGTLGVRVGRATVAYDDLYGTRGAPPRTRVY